MFFYTYLVYCVPIDKYYYGVRVAAKDEPHLDLWVKYFTSSKTIKLLRDEYGDDSFKVKVRRIFKCPRDAFKWEYKVLRRMRVVNNPQWINQSVFNSFAIDKTGEYVQTISDNTKLKMSATHKKFTKMRDPTGVVKLVLKEDRPKLESQGWLFGTGIAPKHLIAGPNHPRFGKRKSVEERMKISNNTRNKPKSNSNRHLKRAVVIDGIVYESVKDAAHSLNIKRTTLNERLRLRPTASCRYVEETQ